MGCVGGPQCIQSCPEAGLSFSESGQWVLAVNSQEPTAAGAGCWGADAYRCQGVAPVERVPRLQGRDMLQTSWAPLPVEVWGLGAGTEPHCPTFRPRWRQPGEREHLGEARGVGREQGSNTRRCTVQGSGGRWSPGVQALSSSRLSSSPPRRLPLAPAPSGHHHPKPFVS